MNDELLREYESAQQPYLHDGWAPSFFSPKSWHYYVEINSGCNLKCVLCAAGNREGYEHVNDTMSMELLDRVLDKIKSENPEAVVLPYGNSEPFLHPQLVECVAAIKAHGLRCELSSNFNRINRLDDVLAAKPDSLIVSVSGFTQAVYERSHHGGDIEVVKANLLTLAEASKRHPHCHVMVHYHMYRDTIGAEFDQMKAFVEKLGFQFIISWARCISMENTIQYLRFKEKERTGSVPLIPIGNDGKDWNALLPPVTPQYVENIERLSFSPVKAMEMYSRHPVPSVCPVGDAFCFIRHDGLASLCTGVCDRRLNLGSYLDQTQEQLSAARRGHPICHECLRYRMNLYHHVVDGVKFNT